MDKQRGTPKQIAKRYEDKVESRYQRTPWRRTRFWFSLVAIVGGMAALYFGAENAAGGVFQHRPALAPSQLRSKANAPPAISRRR